MKRRLLRSLLACAALALALSLVACGNKGDLVRPGQEAPAQS